MKIAVSTEQLSGATREAFEALMAQLQAPSLPTFVMGPTTFNFSPTANGAPLGNSARSTCSYSTIGPLVVALYKAWFDIDGSSPQVLLFPLPFPSGATPTRVIASGPEVPLVASIDPGARTVSVFRQDGSAWGAAVGNACLFQIAYYTE